MTQIQIEHTQGMDQSASMQNLVEKYLPLRTLNMIVEMTEDSFNSKGRARMQEIAARMSE